MLRKMWQISPPVRYARSIISLLCGVKISPSAVFVGATSQVSIAPGVSIGPRTLFSLSSSGKIRLESGVWLSSDVEIETSGRIQIGPATTVQRRCTINGTVSIGAECILAPNVFISSGTHPFRVDPTLSIREQERRILSGALVDQTLDRPVSIGNDCWLGTNVVVCPGVIIGNSCVIGANSVVTKSLLSGGVYAGAPAQKIGDRAKY
jgi:acetyltransferase-like isoleucine patch superfamily enzyme